MSAGFDAAAWARIAPLLDDVLELEGDARTARLAALRAVDPALAAELDGWLHDAERAERSGFLHRGRTEGDEADEADATAEVRPSADALKGLRLGAYVLDARLGEGGTGSVWRAHRADGRYTGTAAVKLLHLSLRGRAADARFEREGAILAKLAHPHIARLLDAGVAAGEQPYLVVELVEGGEPIDRHCDARRLGVAARVALFRQVLDAVAHAHGHLVVHRDLKPANIVVAPDGDVKLLDFGIAKLLDDGSGDDRTALTRDGAQPLTPRYAAPEQLAGGDVTTATDVYALGVLLHELLAGRHPTVADGASPDRAMRDTIEREPRPLDAGLTARPGATLDPVAVAESRGTTPRALARALHGDLDTIVRKALRKAPAERYRTVDAFAADLDRWRRGRPVSARKASWAYIASRFVRRHRVGVAAAAVGCAAVAAGVAGTVVQARRADAQSAIAVREADHARRERDEALEQARLVRGTNEFMQLLMRDATHGEPGAVRRQLERARELIEKTTFEQPIVKVALLRQTASRFAEIGADDVAIDLYRAAIAGIAGTPLAAPGSAVPVNLACSLARQLIEMPDPAAAVVELDRADALAASAVTLAASARVECRVTRGVAELALGHVARAVSTQADALRMLEETGVQAGAQWRVTRWYLSNALAAAGRHAEAMALVEPMARAVEAEQGRASIGVLRSSSSVTDLLRRGGRAEAALQRSEADRRDAAQVLGGEGTDAGFELVHARILLALGRADEAAATFARSARLGRTGYRKLVWSAEIGEADALVAAGRHDEARARLRAVRAAHADRGEADLRPERVETQRVVALLDAQAGAIDAAVAGLDRADRIVVASGAPLQSAAVALASARARVLADRDPAASRAAAARAVALERALALPATGARVATEATSAADTGADAQRLSAASPAPSAAARPTRTPQTPSRPSEASATSR